MFDRKLIPSQNAQLKQQLQNLYGQIHTTSEIRSLIEKKIDKVTQTVKEKIVNTVTISDYFNQLWKQSDLKQNDKDFAVKKLEKIQKVVAAQIIVGEQQVANQSANLNVVNAGFEMTPFEDFNYQEKIKGIRKHKQLDLESDLFAQRASDKEVLHAVNRPYRSVPNLSCPEGLHYTFGLCDIDETEEMKVQKAGDFVKKIKDDKRAFDKKMKQAEQNIETREIEELERLRQREKQEQEQREKEKRQRLEAKVKELKARSEVRLKESTQWEEQYKANLEKRPLFKEIEQRYKKEHMMPELDGRKKKLQELRDFYKPMAREEILEHEKKVMKIIEEKHAERKEQLLENSRWMYQKPAYESKHHKSYADEIARARNRKDEEKLDILRKKERVIELLENVKENHLPKADPQKEMELMAVVEQLNKRKDWRSRAIQSEEPEDYIDRRKLGAEYLQSVKEMVQKIKRAPKTTSNKDISANGLMSDRNQSRLPGATIQSDTTGAVQKPRNYLAELRKENKIHNANNHVDVIIKNKKLDKNEKKKLLQSEVEKLEEKTRRKETVKKLKVRKSITDVDLDDEAEEVDLLYINTIKAKLEMLAS